jgi:tRNA threonylcarbamoyladenosine biosynthesis protein TsaE
MDTFISRSPAQTEAFAETLARKLESGAVVGLNGDLGAGKTQFVKGLARGLGITERVHSPTFALLNVYPGPRFPLYHLDLYRLNDDTQIIGAGLDEYFTPAGISVIEWMERWSGPKPKYFYNIQLESLSETERRITYEYSGS